MSRYRKSWSQVIEEVYLGEALKPIDKSVVDAFYYKKEKEGKIVSTDGDTLTKMGIGGQQIAKWVGRKIKITAVSDVKSTESIIKYIRKSIPSGILEEVELDERVPSISMMRAGERGGTDYHKGFPAEPKWTPEKASSAEIKKFQKAFLQFLSKRLKGTRYGPVDKYYWDKKDSSLLHIGDEPDTYHMVDMLIGKYRGLGINTDWFSKFQFDGKYGNGKLKADIKEELEEGVTGPTRMEVQKHFDKEKGLLRVRINATEKALNISDMKVDAK